MHPQILYMMFPDLEARFNVMWEKKSDQIRSEVDVYAALPEISK